VLPAGAKTLGVPMIFSFFCHNLGAALRRPEMRQAGRALAEELLRDFWFPEHDVVREIVQIAGGPVDAPEAASASPATSSRRCGS
jgi:hypothetical protein